jgi:hypothetical protein
LTDYADLLGCQAVVSEAPVVEAVEVVAHGEDVVCVEARVLPASEVEELVDRVPLERGGNVDVVADLAPV